MSSITSITADQDYDYHSGFYCIPIEYDYCVTMYKISTFAKFFKQGGFIKHTGFISRKG